MLTELRNRGVKDIFIACVDGLKGFPQAIETVFPQDLVQTVHRAPGAGQSELRELEGAQAGGCGSEGRSTGRRRAKRPSGAGRVRRAMGAKYPTDRGAVARQLAAGDSVLRFPAEVRKVIYTTNAVESLNMSLRKEHQDARVVSQRRGGAEADVPGAAQRDPKWERPIHWRAALNSFTLLWQDRIRAATGV